MTKFKNEKEWVAGKKWSFDILEANQDSPNNKGFIYPDGAWIELLPDGRWHTIVGIFERTDFDLRNVERYLYQNHSKDHAQTPRDQMVEELAAYCMRHKLPSQSADELLVDCQVKETAYCNHIHWLEDYIRRWEEI